MTLSFSLWVELLKKNVPYGLGCCQCQGSHCLCEPKASSGVAVLLLHFCYPFVNTLKFYILDCAKCEADNRLKTLSTNQVESIIDCMALFTALVQKIYGLKSGREATEYIKKHYQEFVASVIIEEDVTFSTEISG